MRHPASAFLGIGLAASLVAAFPASPPAFRPPPTEHVLDSGAERKQKDARKAWFRERHKAPPEVDWKERERANGRAQIDKRNALRGRRERSDGYRWVERGSVNQAGRMHAARPSADGSALFAGSALGGVWKGTLDGHDWQPIGDNLYGGAHWLGVLPPDAEGGPDVVLAGTDWGWVHRTADDGLTWEIPDGLDGLNGVRRLLVGADGVVWVVGGRSERWRLYRSTDGARSFEVVHDFGGWDGDAWIPRDGTPGVYVLSNDQLLHSADGTDWAVLGDLPGATEKGELVASEAGGPRFWAVRWTGGTPVLWRSDGGAEWTEVRPLEDYWNALEASSADADTFAWGGVEVHVTHDAGARFDLVNAWWEYYDQEPTKLHADIMGLDVVPDGFGGELWYVSTDGGVYRSGDGLRTVENLSLDGLRVSQYYDTLTSVADPTHVIAGAQDQGQQATLDLEPQGDLFAMDQLISGDYGHLTSTGGTHDWVYSVYPGFILVQVGEDFERHEYADFPAGESYAWLPPLLADPEEPQAFFFAASHLYRYERGAGTWRPERWSDQSFQAYDGEYISAIAASPFDPDRMWVATNWGRSFWSEDRGKTWEVSDLAGPWSQYFYGTALLPSETDEDVVWIGGSGYGFPAVWRSEDGGRTWDDESEGLPDTLVYDLAVAPDGSGRVYAATETAVYEWTPDTGEWRDLTEDDAPVTVYWSVETLRHENTLRFGTYGRGIWDLQLDPAGEGCFPVQDRDGDGSACDQDCDDGDPERSPGLEERCGDGQDQDCDGEDEACPPEEEARGKCGCTVAPGFQPGAALLVLGLLVRRRRA
jgi:hypothetical protein